MTNFHQSSLDNKKSRGQIFFNFNVSESQEQGLSYDLSYT